jgi:hypothetical protein
MHGLISSSNDRTAGLFRPAFGRETTFLPFSQEGHMPIVVRILFPALSCFGPIFMVTGLQGSKASPFGFGLALTGALMTSIALIMIFLVQAMILKARPST